MSFKFLKKLMACLLLCNAAFAGDLMNQTILPDSKMEGVQFVTLDNGYRVWTKRVGEGPIVILTLHGGPGAPMNTSNALSRSSLKINFRLSTMINSVLITPINQKTPLYGPSSAFATKSNKYVKL